MIIKKCNNDGFCFGVKKAIETAYSFKGDNIYVLGELIHNEKVVADLESRGIKTINNLSEIPDGQKATIIIRTHGETKAVFSEAEEKNYTVIDCTCPFVKQIHNIVSEHYNKKYKIVIIGNSGHPEVIGINGWCENTALITENPLDIEALSDDLVCVVVQTTYSVEKFNEIIKKIKTNALKKVAIFKTICYTTSVRQSEADRLSKECSAVLVIGGTKSNNTKKLFDICKKNCADTFMISDADSFDYEKLKKYKKVGIVLGASTPNEQFQEVISNMENITEEIITTETVDNTAATEETVNENEVVETVAETAAEENADNTALSEMENAFNKIKPSKDWKIGQIVVASVSSVKDNGLILSVKNTKADYFELPKEELLNEDTSAYTVGQDIRVMVVAKGPIKFSEKAMGKVLAEEAEIEEIKNGKTFEVTIDSTNKGGLIGKYGRYSVFVPASQIRIGFVKDLDKYVGKTLRLKAEKVESRGARSQIVASQRVILQQERDEKDAIRAQKEAEFFDSVQEGDVVLGTPVRFAAFGAFIDVNGFDCLAHISDLSWTGCENCADVLEIGKQYEFKILKIDAEKKRVSVGYKQLQPKPWETVLERYAIGDTVHGKVVRIVPFGAFVEVEKGIDGLVHVSQISNKWLENPVTALEVGQEVDAKILNIDPEKEKMTLSIKALLPEEPKAEVNEENETKGKGRKRNTKKEETVDPDELHEWKDNEVGGASIADLLNSDK